MCVKRTPDKFGGVAEVCEETGFVSLWWINGFVTALGFEHIVLDLPSQRAVPHVIYRVLKHEASKSRSGGVFSHF